MRLLLVTLLVWVGLALALTGAPTLLYVLVFAAAPLPIVRWSR